MRIAVVNSYPVCRAGVGGITRVDALVRYLAPRHEVTVLAHASGDPAADDAAVAELARVGVTQRLFPLPARSVGSRLRWMAGEAPYFVGYNRNPSLEGALADLAHRDGGVDVVHVEFAHLYPLTTAANGAVRVLAEQETMSLNADRIGAVPVRQRTVFEHYLRADRRRIRAFERASLPRFDLRYAITEVEAGYMRRLSGVGIDVLPHIVDPSTYTPPDAAQEPTEPVALFVGSYRHRPNLHGLHWFVARVWPAVVAAVPDARLDVVGPGMPEEDRRRLAAVPGVHLVGWVDDLRARYHGAQLFVNPIHSGGGMRGKVLEALACGRALVSTRMGLEGIEVEHETHCLVADDAPGFAAAVVRYLRDPALRRAHGAAGRRVVERRYDPAAVFTRLEEDYRAAVAARRRERA
jgi:polysaccharide biosynthesis protein PslH